MKRGNEEVEEDTEGKMEGEGEGEGEVVLAAPCMYEYTGCFGNR